ncbi:MAG: hypothetical protein QM627_10515 [Luteolibacter sp.]
MNSYLVSCENATCAVPEAHRELFRGAEEIVTSGEGWEPGSLNLAQGFSMRLRTPLVHGEVTRLLIDLEEEGPACWSRFSEKLSESTRNRLMDRHHRTYWTTLEQRILEDLRRHDRVLHLMIHTDEATEGTILLQTPPGAKQAEAVAESWLRELRHPELKAVHEKNVKPVPAAAALAGKIDNPAYAPVVLRVSQGFFLNGRPWRWETLKKHLLAALDAAMK